ncbi:MAG: YbhB/YbcL family Raf kinase inhibitor-like protein [Gammaproteobacteria bacterium]
MKLTSTAFENEGNIPRNYTCDGAGISPPLTISNVPTDAVSLVLIMDDSDVPKSIRPDGIWDHWIVYNIPASTTEIAEGEEPAGVHGLGTGKNTNYYGPCPPDGMHRYYFNLYALDTRLDLPINSTKKQVMDAMKQHVLAKAILIGRYKKEGT